MKKKTTLVEYTHSSLINDSLFTVGVYIETGKIKEYFHLKKNSDEEMNRILNEISSECVIALIEKYGCYGIIIE